MGHALSNASFAGILATCFFSLSLSPTLPAQQPPEVAPNGTGLEASTPSALSGKPAPAFFLLPDYLPQVLNEGEVLTVCFRIENTTAKAEEVQIKTEWLASQEGNRALKEELEKSLIGPSSMGSFKKDFKTLEARRMRFTALTPAGPIAGPMLRFLYEGDPWPATKAIHGRLCLATSGEILIPLTRREEKKEDRSWAPLRWALGGKGPGEWKGGQAVHLFLPRAWFPELQVPAIAPASLAGETLPAETKVRGLGGYSGEDGCTPILKVIGEVLENLPEKDGGRVMILLPPDDLEVATNPRVYEVAMEILVRRLRRKGIKELAMAAPFQYGQGEEALKLFSSIVRSKTGLVQGHIIDSAPFMEEALWRVDPGVRGVYGRGPHPNTRKMIAKNLLNWLP